MSIDNPPGSDNGDLSSSGSPYDLSGETPPDDLGTTPAGVAVCLYENLPEVEGPAIELFDPETLDRSVEAFDRMADAEARFRELTASEDGNPLPDTAG